MNSKWHEGDVDRAGVILHYYRTGGDKQSIVLAHGLTDNGLCWSRVAEVLEPDFDVVMLDAVGHGLSSRINQNSEDDPAGDIAHLIEALALDRPHLLGHSMGARSVAMTAARFPGLVSQVILEDPPFMKLEPRQPERTDRDSKGKKRNEEFRQSVLAFADMTEEEIAAFGKGANPSWDTKEFPAWALSKKQVDPAVMSSFKLIDWQEIVKPIEARTLLVYGDRERGGIVSAEIAQQAQVLNSNIEASHVKEAGHNIRREQFDAYMERILDFIH